MSGFVCAGIETVCSSKKGGRQTERVDLKCPIQESLKNRTQISIVENKSCPRARCATDMHCQKYKRGGTNKGEGWGAASPILSQDRWP